MSDLIGKRNWFFLFSALVTIPGLIFILLGPITGGKAGLQFSIDYTGGTEWRIRFESGSVTPEQVRSVLASQGLAEATVAQAADGFFTIRTIPLDLQTPAPSPSPVATAEPSSGASALPSAGASSSPAASASPSPSPEPSPSPSPSPSPAPAGNTELPTSGPLADVATALQDTLGPIAAQAELTTIGPVVSSDLVNQALLLIVVGSLGILLWITFRFHDLKFGVTALVALLHDVIVVVGIFAILGTFFGLQVDALFVTAMLTVIGFSVHDTIVVFDRIRENRARHAGEPFDRIVNHSILQTLGRSINTSFTVILTLLSLLLFGGEAIREFVVALLIGITSGTYSSIFNASPLVVVWQGWEDRRHGRLPSARVPRRAGS